MRDRIFVAALPFVLGVYMPFCTPAVRPTMPAWNAPLGSLWERPHDLAGRDLFDGPWGPERAPDSRATYTFVAAKTTGVNPGMTVTDPAGREWHVKQAPKDPAQGAEGPAEVTLSRILSAVGYHQPPVYYLPSFTVTDGQGTHVEPGGRFRLHDSRLLRDKGEWSWQENPFVGMRPYEGLLVTLMMFNSSDLKNANNTLYEVPLPDDRVEEWYVVRDLGTALGETGRITPKRADPDIFERHAFISGVAGGYVEFSYHGWHQELVRDRITPQDVCWASTLLGGLSDRQWSDAFRAGGFEPEVADRFIGRLKQKIAEGRALLGTECEP